MDTSRPEHARLLIRGIDASGARSDHQRVQFETDLAVDVPPFFAEACGYSGSARYVAVRWIEGENEVLLSDDGHIARGVAGPMSMLWRRDHGAHALNRYRTLCDGGATPWLLIDREDRALSIGCAAAVWRLIEGQLAR